MGSLVRERNWQPSLALDQCSRSSVEEQLQLFCYLLRRALAVFRPRVKKCQQTSNFVLTVELHSAAAEEFNCTWDLLEFVWWVYFREMNQRSCPACWRDMPLGSGAARIIGDATYEHSQSEHYERKLREQLLEICGPYLS